MKNLRSIFTLFAAACLVAVVGCGSDEGATPVAPDANTFAPRVVAFEPVPTDLVVAIDVSDSTSSEELGAIVDALVMAFGDAEVFDQTGSASVAIVAYGDTTASVVTPLATLDAAALAATFAPALQGLSSDRLVTGGAAVLDEALAEAGALLGAGASGNAHLLVLGGGQGADATAVADRCAELAAAGVQVHTVAVGTDAAGIALLESCATATGGNADAAVDVDAIAAAVRRTLALVTVVTLRLEPDTADVARGASHDFTATVQRGVGDDAQLLSGIEVVFEVTSGPSVGVLDTLVTDAAGQVVFTLVGDVPPGTDVVEARMTHPDGDVVVSASASVTWLNQAPDCAVGGPYLVTVDADTVRVVLDASASTDAEGDPLSFLWTVDAEGASLADADSAVAELVLTGAATCADTLEVTLVVSDGFDTSTCVAFVVLDDLRAPVLVAKDQMVQLWPVNHKMHTITPEMTLASVEDACDSLDLSDVVVLQVTSDEAFDVRGSGNTSPDIVIACDGSVQLRAERAGGSDGRVYSIEYAVTDADGMTSTLWVQVHVPHDQSGRGVVAGAPVETVTADCESMSR